MRKQLLLTAALSALATATHANIDHDKYGGYKIFTCRPGSNCHIPADFTNHNFVYLIGGSGDGSAGVANTHAGAPGGSAAFGFKRDMPLTPNSTLVDGVDFHLTHDDQLSSFIVDNLSVTHSLDFGGNAVNTVSGLPALCSHSSGWDICHNGAQTDTTGCNLNAGRRGGPGAPGDAALLHDGWRGECERDIQLSHGGGGGSVGSPYGTAGTVGDPTGGGHGGNSMNNLPGPLGGLVGQLPQQAIDGEGAGGGYAQEGFQDAAPGSCLTIIVADNGDEVKVCGGASGPAGGSITNAGHCAEPSGAGASTQTTGTAGCKGHDAVLAFVYYPHPATIAGILFGGWPANTGGPQIVDSDFTTWPPPQTHKCSPVQLLKCMTVTVGGKSLVLGLNPDAGGQNTWVSSIGYGQDGRNWTNDQYGSTSAGAFRDSQGSKNPTYPGCSDTCGTAIDPSFITTTSTEMNVAPHEMTSFFTPLYRWSKHQEMSPNGCVSGPNCTPEPIGNALVCGVLAVPCDPNAAPGDPNFPTESAELASGWQHAERWQDVSSVYGNTIPVVRRTVLDAFMDGYPARQWNECIGQPDGCVSKDVETNGSGKLIFDPTNLVAHLTLPNGPASKPPDFNVMRSNLNQHLDATVFPFEFFTINGQWQVIQLTPEYQQTCNTDPSVQNNGFTYADGDVVARNLALCGGPPDGGLIIEASSADPDAGVGVGQMKAESGTNVGANDNHILTVHAADGSTVAQDGMVQAFKIVQNNTNNMHDIPVANILTANIWLSGIMAPENLPANDNTCADITSCRQVMVNEVTLALGTPNQIRTALLGAPGQSQTWRMLPSIKQLLRGVP